MLKKVQGCRAGIRVPALSEVEAEWASDLIDAYLEGSQALCDGIVELVCEGDAF